jgi:RNA polymerase sigma-70 factor (ECF subfamily)
LEDALDIPVLDPALADIDIKDISAIICAALETVSVRARSVWKMKREEGMTNKEIAHNLNVSEKTVEADVTRIRKLLHLIIKRNFILTLFF